MGSILKTPTKNKNLLIPRHAIYSGQIIKFIWTYGIALWGCASKSNISVIQRYQSKLLLTITNAPWYVTNQTLHSDLRIPYVHSVLLDYPLRTFRPIYIGLAYRYPPDIVFYIFFSTNTSTEYFKHSAHSPFFSSKCHLFHSATFLVPVLFIFYIQSVLKFKCKTLVPKGYIHKHRSVLKVHSNSLVEPLLHTTHTRRLKRRWTFDVIN